MFSEVILIGRRTRFLAYVSCFPCLFVSEENSPSPSESAYDDDGTTGTVYEQVKEETVGSNQCDDSDSVTKEQGSMMLGKVLKVELYWLAAFMVGKV